MTEPTATQNVKQKARTMGLNFGDRMKIAQAKTQKQSSHKDLDVAILKATSARFHVVPKEKHVTTLKLSIHGGASRMDVDYIITGLLKRLHTATDWLTALKTLITFHRLLRETDISFIEELLKVGEGLSKGRGARVFAMENFLDMTNMEGRFDYSEWVRAYGNYLDEQLELFSIMNWHLDAEGGDKPSRLRSLDSKDLLYQLPQVQRLQRRLVDCVPRGIASRDHVVLFSLTMVLRESFKVYRSVSEGIINLADKFFDMEYLNASKALELYRESIDSSEALNKYYNSLEQLEEIKRSVQLPTLNAPPSDIIASMEAYIREAPRPVSSEGEAPIVRRNVPLRKGRYANQTSAASSTGLRAEVIVPGRSDPGMLLPMGSNAADQLEAAEKAAAEEQRRLAEEQEAAQPTDEQENEVQVEETAPEKGEDDVAASAALPAEFDLLAFDEEPPTGPDGVPQEGPEFDVDQAASTANKVEKPKPTPLDLLSELDFGFNESSTGPPTAASNTSSNNFGFGGGVAQQYQYQYQQQGGGAGAMDLRGSMTYSGMSNNGSTLSSSFPMTPTPTPTGGAVPHNTLFIQQHQPATAAAGGGFMGPVGQYSVSMMPNQPISQFQSTFQPQPYQQQQQYSSSGLPSPAPARGVQQHQGQSPNRSPSPGVYNTASTTTATGGVYTSMGMSMNTKSVPAAVTGVGGGASGKTQDLFKTAGAHDPFSALSGLPRK